MRLRPQRPRLPSLRRGARIVTLRLQRCGAVSMRARVRRGGCRVGARPVGTAQRLLHLPLALALRLRLARATRGGEQLRRGAAAAGGRLGAFRRRRLRLCALLLLLLCLR